MCLAMADEAACFAAVVADALPCSARIRIERAFDWQQMFSRFGGCGSADTAAVCATQGFVDACDEQVQRMGWERFFKKFDADGDGELNQAEFMKAVRANSRLRFERRVRGEWHTYMYLG